MSNEKRSDLSIFKIILKITLQHVTKDLLKASNSKENFKVVVCEKSDICKKSFFIVLRLEIILSIVSYERKKNF